jgi:type II secretory pathway component PulJ
MLGRRRQVQAGLSLVELLVGIVVGMFVVAAAGMLIANQLSANRRLLLEAQVQQDLRSAMDIITKEIRRMGFTVAADNRVWLDQWSSLSSTVQNHNLSVPSATEMTFRYTRASGESGPYGFKLDDSTYSVKSLLAESGWHELTDPRSVKVTAFSITPLSGSETVLACPKMCPDGTDGCWPRHQVLEYRVNITAESASDSAVVRSLSTKVRVRNEYLNSVGVSSSQPCPL